MALSGVQDFLTELERLHLLDEGLLRSVRLGPLPTEARALAGDLIRRGWLTPYQANQLLQGKGAGLLLGSYVLLERLGEGGMGQVYKARNWKLGRVVALKVIHRDRLGRPRGDCDDAFLAAFPDLKKLHAERKAEPPIVERFRREVRAAAQLSHPNIVHAYDAEHHGETLFLVMEFVEGTDLGRLIESSGPLPVPLACEFAAQVALALQHAHDKGLVHRDVKPSNLLLARKEGVVKLLDLGLAKLGEAPDELPGATPSAMTLDGSVATALTREGAVMGTPDFMAPEQAGGAHTVDVRADLYSLGCTLYYLLTGRPPFPGGTVQDKLRRHRLEAPEPIGRLRPDTPSALQTVLDGLLAKDPAVRYPTPADAAAALAAVARGERPAPPPQPARASAPIARPPGEAFAGLQSTAAGATAWRERRARLLVGVAVVLVMGLAIYLAFRERTSGPQSGPGANAPTSPEEELDRLRVQADSGEPEAVAALQAFRLRNRGSPLALRAAFALARLPSPLDALALRSETEKLQVGQPRGLVHIYGDPRHRHWGAVNAVAFHPDGRLAVSGGDDGYLRLWDIDTGEEKVALKARNAAVAALDFAPGGGQFASGYADGQVRTWSIDVSRPGLVEGTAWGADVNVAALAYRPDGKALALSGYPGIVVVCDLSAPNARKLALRGHKGPVASLAWSPDGRLLASGGDKGELWLWAPERDEPQRVVRTLNIGGGQYVNGIAFHPDGKSILAVSVGAPAHRWDLTSFEATEVLTQGPVRQHRAVAWLPGGKGVVSAGPTGTYLWNEQGAEPVRVDTGGDLPSGQAYALALSPDGKRLVTAGDDGRVRFWDLAQRRELHPTNGPAGALQALALAPDDKLIAVTDRAGALWTWETATGRLHGRKALPGGSTEALAWSSDGKLLATGNGAGIDLWEATGLERTCGLLAEGAQGLVCTAAFSEDGRFLATGDTAGRVYLWNLAERTVVHKRTFSGRVPGVAFDPSGPRLALVAQNGEGELWSIESQPGLLAQHSAPKLYYSLAWRPDGHVLLAGTFGGFQRWIEEETAPRGAGISVPGVAPISTAWSPDGRRIAVADNMGRVYVVDVAREKPVLAWSSVRMSNYHCLAWAADSRHLFVGNADGTAYLVRLAEPATPAH